MAKTSFKVKLEIVAAIRLTLVRLVIVDIDWHSAEYTWVGLPTRTGEKMVVWIGVKKAVNYHHQKGKGIHSQEYTAEGEQNYTAEGEQTADRVMHDFLY